MGTQYAGVWGAGSGTQELILDLDWRAFDTKWQQLSSNKLRLVDFTSYVKNNQRVFAGVFRPGSDDYALWVDLDWDSFKAKWEELSNQGLRLTNIETWADGNVRKFAGVWREGSDDYSLWVGVDWGSFHAKWQELSSQGQRLVDFQTYVDGTTRQFAGVWRAGKYADYLWAGADWASFQAKLQELGKQGLRLMRFRRYVEGGDERFAGVWKEGDRDYLWVGVDNENITAKTHELEGQGLRLVDVEAYEWGCSDDCANQVVARNAEGKVTPYIYTITGDNVSYRWPVDDDKYARLSAIYFDDKIFTLPFSDTEVVHWGTWEYSPHYYHLAIDYLRQTDWKTFGILAAAPGKVIFVGWDNWSGNTIVVSHDAGGVSDAFRTIYMHLRNGADHDANASWKNTIPSLQGENLTKFKEYLNLTGATQDPSKRNLNQDYWGTNSETISASLLGSTVSRGQMIAWAGATGPGGCGFSAPSRPNTHLHIFFCRRDPTNNKWYFVDPYGIYSYPGCYPGPVNQMATGPCVRYGVAWQDGRPQYP